jgi:uncharacterized protein (UPF0264 family)
VFDALGDTPGLLVSVRDPVEAIAGLRGGAAIIDIKEPNGGSLGPADLNVTAAIVDAVAGKRIISAAMGELVESTDHDIRIVAGIQFVKFGLAGCGSLPDWRDRLLKLRATIEVKGSERLVAVAYADWQRAEAPPLERMHELAIDRGFPVLLIDTWRKDGTTLLDWLSVSKLVDRCEAARSSGVRMALAGSLGLSEIRKLRAVRPDWFAVRGAACVGGKRDGRVDEARVRKLVEALGDRMGTKEKEQPCETP